MQDENRLTDLFFRLRARLMRYPRYLLRATFLLALAVSVAVQRTEDQTDRVIRPETASSCRERWGNTDGTSGTICFFLAAKGWSVTVEVVERKQWKPHALVRNLSNRTSIVPVNTSEDAVSPLGITPQMPSPGANEGYWEKGNRQGIFLKIPVRNR